MPQLRDDTSNIDILNAIRSDARYDYQNMVPEATKANIQETIAGIMSDNITRNEFMSSLVNRIGSTIVRDISWKNPLAVFKQGMMNFGDTIEEVHLDFIKPTIMRSSATTLSATCSGRPRRLLSLRSIRLTARKSLRSQLTVTCFVGLFFRTTVFLR